VMDGRFVPTITIGPAIVAALSNLAAIPFDVPLLLVSPEQFSRRFSDRCAASISVHVEACPPLHRVLEQLEALGCRAGVALNPHTPAATLGDVLDHLELINVMTVNPGFGGQTFIKGMISKLRKLRAMVDNSGKDIEIEVDGGINIDTIAAVIAAGATIAIAGAGVFQHERGIAAGIDALRQRAARATDYGSV